ncbi:TPA: thrombospondin type 3 repeat-containing protein, partial [archaeon]|nr:thrombospondin type 3 repeat-containing protein [Candidatus Undinarchaeales archaeon SRR5007147.bin71]
MASSSEKGVNRYLTGGALVLLLLIVGYAFFSGGGILGGKFVAASGEECTNSIELQLSDTGRFVLREEGQTFSSANVGWASSYSCADDGICTQGETGFDALIDDALEEARDPSNGFEDSIVYNCIKYDGLFYKSGSSAGGGPPADDGGGDRDGGDSGGTAGGGGVSADSSPQEEPEIDWLDTSAADDWFIFKNSDGNGVLWFLNQMANGMWVIMQLAFAEGGGPQTLDPGSASGLGLDSLDGLLPGGQFPDSESSSTMLSNVKSLVAPNGADSSGTDKSSLNDQLKLCGCEYKSELGWSGTENEGSRTCGSWRDTPTYCSQNSNYCTWTCNDADSDGIGDATDNCPTVSNTDQKDFDMN